MKNINFYYLADEHEPKIIIVDNNKREAFSIDELDLSSIEKFDYPTKDVLDDIVATSTNDGYDGTWESIKFILDTPNILEKLVLSTNREEFILKINNNNNKIKEDMTIDILIERFWERFENQSSIVAKKYIELYNKGIDYFKSLSNNEIEKLLLKSDKLSNKEYFYLILNNANIMNDKINEKHFSF